MLRLLCQLHRSQARKLPKHLPYVLKHGGGRVCLGRRAPECNRSLHGREHEARRCGSDEPDVVDHRNEESEVSRCLGQFHFQFYPRRVQFGLLQPQTEDSSGAYSGDRYAAHEGPQPGSCMPGAARAAWVQPEFAVTLIPREIPYSPGERGRNMLPECLGASVWASRR